MPHVPSTGQGPAKIATDSELELEIVGYTNPNLHRRVDPSLSELSSSEVQEPTYRLGIYGTDSYRTVHRYYRDDENPEEISETP